MGINLKRIFFIYSGIIAIHSYSFLQASYSLNNTLTIQQGTGTIFHPFPVAISSDGSTVAVGKYTYDSDQGQVIIYQNQIGTLWSDIGSITGSAGSG